MSVAGKKRLRSIIEEAISRKTSIKEITRVTFRSDAAAILESLLGELEEDEIVSAMNRQRFDGEAYRSSIRALAVVAKERRESQST